MMACIRSTAINGARSMPVIWARQGWKTGYRGTNKCQEASLKPMKNNETAEPMGKNSQMVMKLISVFLISMGIADCSPASGLMTVSYVAVLKSDLSNINARLISERAQGKVHSLSDILSILKERRSSLSSTKECFVEIAAAPRNMGGAEPSTGSRPVVLAVRPTSLDGGREQFVALRHLRMDQESVDAETWCQGI